MTTVKELEKRIEALNKRQKTIIVVLRELTKNTAECLELMLKICETHAIYNTGTERRDGDTPKDDVYLCRRGRRT